MAAENLSRLGRATAERGTLRGEEKLKKRKRTIKKRRK